MKHNLVIAGFGGQGILFAGKTLAYAGMDIGKYISWLPSYGPEMRGGTANCSVILSDEPIGSPLITKPDTLLAMNKPSLDKFEDKVKPGGVIVVESVYIDKKVTRDDVEVVYIPAKRIAEELGNGNLGNMVMVGVFAQLCPMLPFESICDSIRQHVPSNRAELAEANIRMLGAGYTYKVC